MQDRQAETGHFFVHVFALGGFAVAQPIYDWVSRQPEFLVAHGFDLPAAVFLVGLLSFAVPAAMAAVAHGVRVIRPGALLPAQATMVGLLVGVFVMQLLTAQGTWVAFGLAAAAGVAAGLTYAAVHVARSFLAIAAIGAVAFPALFLLTDPVRGMVWPGAPPELAVPEMAPTPDHGIVVLVLDELPLSALLANEREIDAERFPGFARLAAESIWYPNASAVHIGTTRALPALLTGRIPTDRDALSRWEDHPDNLFIWAHGAYGDAVAGHEAITALCPSAICPPAPRSRTLGLVTLGLDVAVLLGHRTLPDRVARTRLPQIDNRWRNFVGVEWAERTRIGGFRDQVNAGRTREWRRFVNDIGSGFNFVHVLLPHDPYVYLPDGTRYRGRTEGIGSDDVWRTEGLNLLEYQRFLAQLQYTDRLLGEMIDRLQADGLWDSLAVVVVADHGKSFRLGAHKRRVAPGTLQDVLNVPFFVKAPGQSESAVDEFPASIIDLAPTVADLAGVDLDWEPDGVSLIAEAREARDRVPVSCMDRTCEGEAADALLRLDHRDIARTDALAWKQAHITWSEWAELFVPAGPHLELLGRSVSGIAIDEDPSYSVEIHDDALFGDVAPERTEVPALVRGVVAGSRAGSESPPLALALNGRIVGLAPAVPWDGQPGYFAALLPAEGFVGGANDLEVFRVEAGGSEPILARLGVRLGTAGLLAEVDGQPVLIPDPSTEPYRIDSEAVQGWIDRVLVEGDVVRIWGWAADVEAGQAVEAVMGFGPRYSFTRTVPSHDRDGLAEQFGSDAVNPAGFEVAVPRRTLTSLSEPPTFYGLSIGVRGVAGRLRYTGTTSCMIERLPDDPSVCESN